MKIQQILELGVKELKKSSISSPLRHSQLLLSFVIKKDILYLITNDNKILDNKIIDIFLIYIKRACGNEPLEYITNNTSFYGKDFFVNEDVLIPRPESEILIQKAIQYIKKTPCNIAEIGAGSGILSITLANIFKNTTFIATDVSKKALKIASRNAKTHNVFDKISFIHTSLLDGIKDNVDIVISNPPYIKNGYKLDKNVCFEPDISLFGGDNGDEILKDIIDLIYKKGIKLLICEMGYDQKQSIYEHINNNYIYKDLIFYKDLAGFDRGFILDINHTRDTK